LLIKKADQLLDLRRQQDKMGYYHGRLAEIERQLTWAKKRVRQDGASYSELYELAAQMHQEMLEMAKGRAKTSDSNQKTQASGQAQQKKQQSRNFDDQGTKGGGAQSGGAGTQQKEEAKSKQQGPDPDGDQHQARGGKKESQRKTADLPDWYALLGLSPNATEAEIKAAYRSKIKEYHPDKHDASDFDWVKQEAERMTRLVGQAYECLTNPSARKKYDQSRNRSS